MEPINPMLIHGQEWVINISRILEEALEEKDDDDQGEVAVSIFNVPKTLMFTKPEAYTPQVVALGPYHRRRPELFEMERYKLTSAKRVQKNFGQSKLRDLVRCFEEKDSYIRGYYHRFLEFDEETLAWTLAIDAAFLLEYLQTYSAKTMEGSSLMRISSKMAHLIDYTRRKTAHHTILRDIIMLENQMPLFLIRDVNGLHKQHQDDPDEDLANMLLGFCKDLSPFKFVDVKNFREDCFGKAHMLDLLYSFIVPKTMAQLDNKINNNEQDQEKDCDHNNNDEIIIDKNSTSSTTSGSWYLILKKTLKRILGIICLINMAPIWLLGKIRNSKTMMLLLMLPYKIVVHLSCLKAKTSTTTSAVSDFITSAENVAEEMENIFLAAKHESPLVEEISIPTVSELSKTGVKFVPYTNGGLGKISFDKSSGQFRLPVVRLDDNSDVVLRNLVAYEASVAPEVVAFTRYTELMNGIIDTEEDVRILREARVVVNRLKSDGEAAALWNGMTKSVKTTRVPVLDKAIEEVNGYYWGSWRVRIKVAMKSYVFCSWPILVFLAANVLLLLSALEAGCSMYNCSKWFRSEN